MNLSDLERLARDTIQFHDPSGVERGCTELPLARAVLLLLPVVRAAEYCAERFDTYLPLKRNEQELQDALDHLRAQLETK